MMGKDAGDQSIKECHAMRPKTVLRGASGNLVNAEGTRGQEPEADMRGLHSSFIPSTARFPLAN